jgi:hypothetical protein
MAYGIPQLRQRSIMSGWDNLTPDMGDDYSGYGDTNVPYPTPSTGPYETAPPKELFGRENTPSMPTAVAETPSSGVAGLRSALNPNQSHQDMMDAINKIYTPENVDRDRLRSLMDNFPERQAPGFGRALVAAGMSVKAADPIATSEAIMNAPHRRDMADWTAKTEPFYKTADLENRANINERTLAGNVVKSVNDADRISMQERTNEGKQRVAEQKAESDRIRARAYEAKNNGWTVKVAGDRIVAVNPVSGAHKDLGDSGAMNQKDLEDLKGEWGVAKADAYGKAAADRAAISQSKEFTDKEGNVWVQKPGSPAERTDLPAGSKPSSVKADVDTPVEAKTRRQSKVMEIFQTHPEYQDQFTERNGIYELKKRPVPSMFSSKEDEIRRWDEANQLVNPGYKPPTAAKPAAPKESFSEININPKAPTFSGSSTKGIGPSAPNAAPNMDLQGRAAAFLEKNGKPVTKANIEHVIRTGGVK